jgi:hypothetical protein
MLDINAPLFTTQELCRAAGLEPALAKAWIARGLLDPDRADPIAVRRRPLFSVMTIFRARLARELSDQLGIRPADAEKFNEAKKRADEKTVKGIARASGDVEAALRKLLAEGRKPPRTGLDRLTRVVADEGWTWAVARSVERGKPLQLLGGISRENGCWDFHLALDAANLADRFGSKRTYAVIPVGGMFADVYGTCGAMYQSGLPASQKSSRRVRAR